MLPIDSFEKKGEGEREAGKCMNKKIHTRSVLDCRTVSSTRLYLWGLLLYRCEYAASKVDQPSRFFFFKNAIEAS